MNNRLIFSLILLGLIGSLNAATSTTSAYTTIPSNPILTNSSSIPQILSYSLIVPYFILLLIFLVMGIVYVDTRKPEKAIVSGFIIALIIYGLVPKAFNVNTIVVLGLILGISIIIEIFVKMVK